MKKRVSRKYLDGLVNKIISETLEEKADMLMSKIKTNVNELGGMDSEHPKFGKTKFADMSDEEIDDLIRNYHSGDDEFEDDFEDDFEDEEDEDEYEGNWVHPLGESEIEDLMNSEVDEQFDSEEMKGFRDNKPFTRREFRKIPKGSEIDTRNLRDDSITMNKFLKNKLKDRFRDYDDDEDFDLMFESDGEVCECGGNLYEGICEECGNTYGMVGEEDGEEDLGYATHDGSFGGDDSEEEEGEENVGGCKTVRDVIKKQGGEMTDLDKETIKKYNCKSLKESLSDNQRKKIDKNKNGKIDSEDFKLLRKKKKSGKVTDVEEGNEFTGELAKAKKQGKDSFEVGGKKFKVKESIQLSEEELIQLIENIIKEDSKTNLKNVGGEPRGLRKYKEVHAKDGKENDDYIKSVAKKMKDYLKDGSKGSYEENPKHLQNLADDIEHGFYSRGAQEELVEQILAIDPNASIIWGSVERFNKQLEKLEAEKENRDKQLDFLTEQAQELNLGDNK